MSTKSNNLNTYNSNFDFKNNFNKLKTKLDIAGNNFVNKSEELFDTSAKTLGSWLNNEIVLAIFTIFIFIYSSAIAPALPGELLNLFNSPIVKFIFISAIALVVIVPPHAGQGNALWIALSLSFVLMLSLYILTNKTINDTLENLFGNLLYKKLKNKKQTNKNINLNSDLNPDLNPTNNSNLNINTVNNDYQKFNNSVVVHKDLSIEKNDIEPHNGDQFETMGQI
jgi:low affinity Fe/Cu permease